MIHEKRDRVLITKYYEVSEIGPNISETREFLFIMITATMMVFFGKQISQLTIAYAFFMSSALGQLTLCINGV